MAWGDWEKSWSVAKKEKRKMLVRKAVANFMNKKRGYIKPNPVGRPRKNLLKIK